MIQLFVRRVHISFGAVSKVAERSSNQVIDIVGVAVDNLDIGSPVMDLVTPMELDNAVNLSVSNGGMSSREPSCGGCSTVELVNFRVN